MQCKHLFDKEENNALQSSRLNTHISKCGSIKITKKSNEKNLIVFDVSHPNGLKNILKRRVFVKYDIDVTRVDDSILNVPAVAGIINIAWAFGIDICIDTLDRSYLKSLEKIKQVMRHWHPYFPMTTQIHVNKVITNNFSNNGFGLLFTGGIDSTTSYIKHKDEKINLINVIEEESRRALKSKEVFKMMRRLRKFARNEEVKINFIKTNLTPSESIQAYFFERFGLRLWEDVSHGMILTGLCAPLTVTNGIGTVLIASSITPSYKYSWGSHPRIDNRISWADIKVRNDKYRMSRFQKMGVIKAYIEKTGNIPTLRSCDLPLSGNCGKCIKCLRTITGLVLRGIDPNKVGFPDVTEHTLQLIKTRILNENFFERKRLVEKACDIKRRTGKLFFWKDLQEHIPSKLTHNLIGSRGFFEWFKNVDLDERYKQSKNIRLSILPKLAILHFYNSLPPMLRKVVKKGMRPIRQTIMQSVFSAR